MQPSGGIYKKEASAYLHSLTNLGMDEQEVSAHAYHSPCTDWENKGSRTAFVRLGGASGSNKTASGRSIAPLSHVKICLLLIKIKIMQTKENISIPS